MRIPRAPGRPLPTWGTDRTDIVKLYRFHLLDWSFWVWKMYIPHYCQQIVGDFDIRINNRTERPLTAWFVSVRAYNYPDSYMNNYILELGGHV
jgi:hypothetical protein